MIGIKIENSAKIIGKVRLGKNTYIAQGSTIRSENDSVRIGNSSALLENSVIIGSKESPVKIGSKTIFGHKTAIIGAEIGDLCEIGNNTIFLPNCKVGDMCVFGEGTIVLSGMVIPSNSVVLGRPARIIRTLNNQDKKMIKSMRSNDITLDEVVEVIVENFKGDVSVENIKAYKGKSPKIEDSTYIDDLSEITGDVKIGANCYIASGVKIIGNSHGPVEIGSNVSILENTVLHLLPDNKLVIDDNVTIGPNCTVHGTIIGKNSIIEAGAIICDYSEIGENSLIRAGSLVKQRDKFNNDAIIEGFPGLQVGKNLKTLTKPSWSR